MKTKISLLFLLFLGVAAQAQRPWSLGVEAGSVREFHSVQQPAGPRYYRSPPTAHVRLGLKIIHRPEARNSFESGLFLTERHVQKIYADNPASFPPSPFYSVARTQGGNGIYLAAPLLWRHQWTNRDGLGLHVRAGLVPQVALGNVIHSSQGGVWIPPDSVRVTDVSQTIFTRLHLNAQLGLEGTIRISKRWYGFGNLAFNYGLHEKQRTIVRYTHLQEPERKVTYHSRGTGYQWGLGLRYQFR